YRLHQTSGRVPGTGIGVCVVDGLCIPTAFMLDDSIYGSFIGRGGGYSGKVKCVIDQNFTLRSRNESLRRAGRRGITAQAMIGIYIRELQMGSGLLRICSGGEQRPRVSAAKIN